MTGSEMNKLTVATMQVEALRKQLADAQATVEALQRERDEAITAHRNIVKQFDELTCFIGCDYDPETETWVSGEPPYLSAGTNEVEACKAAVDALRSVAIVLQTALDAERAAQKALCDIIAELRTSLNAERAVVTRLEEECAEKCVAKDNYITTLIEAKNKAQAKLSQLQALVRALPVVSEVTSDTVVNLVQQYSFHAWMLRALQLRATLDATTPDSNQLGDLNDMVSKGGDGE